MCKSHVCDVTRTKKTVKLKRLNPFFMSLIFGETKYLKAKESFQKMPHIYILLNGGSHKVAANTNLTASNTIQWGGGESSHGKKIP